MPIVSSADRWLDDLIRQHVDPLLRGRGFVRRERAWNRDLGAVRHVIDVQTDASDDSDRSPIPSRFTINLAVFVPIFKTWTGVSPPAFVDEVDCPVRERIGHRLPSGVDRWWFITPTSDASRTGNEVAKALVDYGLPFLDPLQTLESVATWVEQPRHYHAPLLATIRAHQGDPDGARRVLDELARDESWLAVVAKLKSQLRLD